MADEVKTSTEDANLEDKLARLREKYSLPTNEHCKYLYHAWFVTLAFFVVAMVSSAYGFSHPNTDLTFIVEDNFIASLLFLGFVISVNERIMEVAVKTFRRRTRTAYEMKLENALMVEDEKYWKHTLNDYRAETGRFTLWLSLVLGCSLASLGMFRLLGPLNNEDMMASNFHIYLVDAVDVVITGWVVAGGTEGWSKLVTTLRDVMSIRKDFESNK